MNCMKIGIIGFGNIAKKHLEAIKCIPQCQLVAVHDQVAPANLPEGVEYRSDISDMMNSELDIITICTPNGYHAQHSIMALNAGKHVICEKPFALKENDCNKIISAAEKNNKQVFCVMQNRFSPVSQWLKELVDKEALGDIFLVNVCCYWNRNLGYYHGSEWRGSKEIDGGTLFTQFSHYVDSIYWLFGDMEIKHASLSNNNHLDSIDFEDTGSFEFALAGGGMGNFSYTTSCYDTSFESTMTIIGSNGTVKIAGQYMNEIEYCNVKDLTVPDLLSSDNIDNIASVYRNALDSLENQGKIMTTPSDGMKIVSIIEDVYKFQKEQ